jgi:large subunit ribosomal protein L7e
MSKPAKKQRVTRKQKQEKRITELSTDVQKWINKTLGREVNVPGDLSSGVVACQLINKLAPNSIAKIDESPKTDFAKAANFRRFNKVLLKFGYSPLELPCQLNCAQGKETHKLVRFLHKMSTRATSLRPAPETIVKLQKAKAKRHHALIAKVKRAKKLKLRHHILGAIRAARYQRYYKAIRESNIKRHIKAEKRGNFFVPAEPRVAFVMRLRGINGVPPKPKKILRLFRLRQIHNAVFVRLNKATLNMLKIIEPYVAIGYPSVRSIRALLLKRGYGTVRGQRIPITSNTIIYHNLGKFGIYTLDDVVFKIFTAGKHFSKINRFLWPFKMNSPRGGFKGGKLRHFVEGGAHGNRMGMVNKLIRQCL